jgi:eukaryotic-like serine/threonine-protein kinase
MTPARWQNIERLFHEAVALGPAARAAFLAEACGADAALRQAIDSLLAHHEQSESFIESPAFATPGALDDEERESLVGRTIGHYRIIKALGEGGMGEVYLAQDEKLGRKVALKFLPSFYTKDRDRLRRFTQEARAASALNHPNIITIYEVGETNDHQFIATEFIEGETLRERLSRAPMKLGEALDVSIQVANALAAAHAVGIIHRDIKPENIMLRRDEFVKVLDFGLAKLSEAPAAVVDTQAGTKPLIRTDAGTVMGTVNYMSPEQARGLVVDARTDIFSLAVVIYEMVAGRAPFGGATRSDLIVALLERDPPPLARFAPETPAELERLVMKALAKDRDARYQTAKDLLIDLRGLKQKLVVDAEIERTAPPEVTAKGRETKPTDGQVVSTAPGTAAQTAVVDAIQATSSAEYIVSEIKRHKKSAGLTLLTLVIITAAAIFFYHKRAPALTEKDTILLTDFTNTTGDAAFDSTLKQALAVQLEQSPFLNIFPDERVRKTLRLMNRPPDERVTPTLGREICQRQGLKAMLTGSIASLGRNYVISLEAVNAQTDEVLAREQSEAEGKEQVLKTLGETTTRLRQKVGESLASIRKFDVPLTQATTSSLEALRAFSLGDAHRDKAEFTEAISFYKRAVELDPNFASAYQRIGTMYGNIGQSDLGMEFSKKAFALRERATERERFHITSAYYVTATKELDNWIEVLELWRQTYPRDFAPRNNLAYAYIRVGQYEKAIEEASEGIRLNPNAVLLYNTLGGAYRALGRYDEARAIFEQAHARNLDISWIHLNLYLIAFVQGDQAEMQRQLEWSSGKPDESYFLAWQSRTKMFSGLFRQSQETTRRAVESAQGQNLNDWAADITSTSAAWNALVGNCQQARAETTSALALARGRTPPSDAALALALCGDAARAQSLIDELARREPTDTDINAIFIPLIRAAIETGRGNGAQAIQLLQKPRRYEMGQDAEFWPTYVRGQAYLRQGSATEAMTEFQRIIDRRSVSPAHILYPLAYLGLARAAALSGDTAKGRKAYEDFFALWKDADSDIPILIEAKKEYERLQ